MTLDKELMKMGESIDEIINVDIGVRGMARILYKNVRDKIGSPLALTAAQKLSDVLVEPGRVVVISTGCSHLIPGIPIQTGEMDGPAGTVVLGRSLGRALNAIPLFLTEEGEVDALATTARYAGLTMTSLEGAKIHARLRAADGMYVTIGLVEGFPAQDEEAMKAATILLDKFDPAAVITVEKSGRNEKGVYHTSSGIDRSEGRARVDFLVEEAKKRDIPTIACIDGGNEIGGGLIRDAIKKHIPYGAKCRCPCGAGIAPVTATDLVVSAAVANWGAYGIAACIAAITDTREAAHNPDFELRILNGAAMAGYIDSEGYAGTLCDGLGPEIHAAIVRLLARIIQMPFRELKMLERRWM